MGGDAQVMRRDEVSGAPTLLYKVLVDRGVSWGQACELLSETLAASKALAERAEVGLRFYLWPDVRMNESCCDFLKSFDIICENNLLLDQTCQISLV